MSQIENAARRIMRTTGSIAAAAGARLFFGPFQPGEFLRAVKITGTHPSGLSGVNPNGIFISIQAGMFLAPPGSAASDTLPNFVANGRGIFAPLENNLLAGPFLPSRLDLIDNAGPLFHSTIDTELPLAVVVTGEERYLGIHFGNHTSSVDSFTLTAWIIPGHSDAHDRAE